MGFDIVHRVTFMKYWAPAAAALVGASFASGQVGGGESMPRAFRATLSPSGRRCEFLRPVARFLGEHDPLVRATANRAVVAFATTLETAVRLQRIRTTRVSVLSAVALTDEEYACLRATSRDCRGSEVLFFSAGNLLDWTGYHLSLAAFAEADMPDARFVLAGDGPARKPPRGACIQARCGRQGGVPWCNTSIRSVGMVAAHR